MKNTNDHRQGIANIPYICQKLGISNAVICPGSRNAPLIMSFTKNKNIKSLSISDERSAAYFALGIAQYTKKPVALVCTSGTAALNLAPAIAEAFYQNLPLVVFTADRPAEWVDQADGQVLNQQNIFANYIKSAYNLPLETVHDDDLWYCNRSIAQAVNDAVQCPAGPVHINVPLREPLYTPLPNANEDVRIIESSISNVILSLKELEILKRKWNNSQKIMIVVGINEPNAELHNVLNTLSLQHNIVVMAENLSNISGEKIIGTTESFITFLKDEEMDLLQPHLLVTIGHSIVSKSLKQYLRKYQPCEHWHIGVDRGFIDTFKSLTQALLVNPVWLLNELSDPENKMQSEYSSFSSKKIEKIVQFQNRFLKAIPFSDIAVFQYLLNEIPSDTVLQLANSTPIRLSQLFSNRSDLVYYANRGTSGIDGCVSTAAGAAYSSQKPTIVITGDIAFIYDSNALWNNHFPDNFKVIVINNKSGNIFRLIDTTPEIDSIRDYFETPHQVNIQSLSEAFGFHFLSCSNMTQLGVTFKTFLQLKKPAVLEIQTDIEVNTSTFKEFYKQLKLNT